MEVIQFLMSDVGYIPIVSDITKLVMGIVEVGDKGLPELVAKIQGLEGVADKIGDVMNQIAHFTMNIDFSGLTKLIEGIGGVFGA